jgi:hypothetical protein
MTLEGQQEEVTANLFEYFLNSQAKHRNPTVPCSPGPPESHGFSYFSAALASSNELLPSGANKAIDDVRKIQRRESGLKVPTSPARHGLEARRWGISASFMNQ